MKANHLKMLGVEAVRQELLNIDQSFRIVHVFKWRRDFNSFSEKKRSKSV